MALSGVHFTFGYAQSALPSPMTQTPLPYGPVSSQTMASGGTSSISAPPAQSSGLRPLLSISASAAIFYAVGKSPDASGNAGYPRRYYDPSFGREDVLVEPGDLVAWVFA